MTSLSIVTAVVVCSTVVAGGSPEGHLPWLDLEAKLDSLRIEYDIPGLTVVLVSGDSVLQTYCVGVADHSTSTHMTDSTLFRMGSVAKSFVALAVMQMVEEGTVDLDTPLDELIPEIAIDNPWSATSPVRVVHLLEHTSGMEDLHHWEYFNVRHDPNIPARDYLEMSVGTRRLMWRPGTRMAYSSHGYAVLRYLIEKVSGIPFEAYMNDSILTPLGMSDSRFGLSTEDRVHLAQGYRGDSTTVTWLPKYKRSLYSSIRDMARFTALFINGGRLKGEQRITQSTLARMETPQSSTAARKGLAIGYGLGLRTRYLNGIKYLGHSGNIPGYTSIFAYYPEHSVGYAMIMNTSNTSGFTPLRRQIQEFLLPGVSPVVPPSPPLSSEELRQYTGYYLKSNHHLRIMAAGSKLIPQYVRMELVGDTLWEVDSDDRRHQLIPVAPGLFRRENQSEATVIFALDDDGNQILVDPIYFDEYIKGSSLLAKSYSLLAIACISVAFSVVVYALIWLVFKIIGRIRGRPLRFVEILIRTNPAAAVLVLFGAIFLTFSSSPDQAIATGLYDWKTILLFIATIVFPILTMINLGILYIVWQSNTGRIGRIYLTAVAAALCIISGFMAYWDLLGIKIWSY